ncbi:hypothetical protein BASA81_015416 [Batrachochytrium salamandrivorans]|nr:hypothetical protein BASA81_015416 [Batrachochytrium salamandrivorans]
MRTVQAKPCSSVELGRRKRQSWFVTVFCPRAFSNGGLAQGYFSFQLYDTLQALCSYLRAVLCNRGLLRALGVGTDNASATAAALTFLTRDGVGMFASLGLAFSYSQSFGREVKFWRLFADVCNDVALVLDLVAPWWGGENAFLLLVCISSALKAFCGVAAGATRAAITNHFALNSDDLADVAAKEGSQETAVTLLGMLLGYWFLDHVSEDNFVALWGLFAGLTVVHVWANFQAVSSLHFRTLDEQRLGIILAAHQNHSVLSFEQVSLSESIVIPWPSTASCIKVIQLDSEQAVWVNDLLPDIGFVDIKGQVGVVVAENGREDELVEQQVCAALALLSSTSTNAQCCAKTAHEHLDLVRELKALGWDFHASCTLLGFSKHKRAKFKQH